MHSAWGQTNHLWQVRVCTVRDLLQGEIARMPGVFEHLKNIYTPGGEYRVELAISAWEAKQTAAQRPMINSWENRMLFREEKRLVYIAHLGMALTGLHNFQGKKSKPFFIKKKLVVCRCTPPLRWGHCEQKIGSRLSGNYKETLVELNRNQETHITWLGPSPTPCIPDLPASSLRKGSSTPCLWLAHILDRFFQCLTLLSP